MTTKVTNIYNLKLTPSQFGQNSIVVNCSQYDSLYRVIQFNLLNGTAPYSIPDNSVVTIRGTKKDLTGFEYECTYSNNVVTFPIQPQITIYPGKVPAELRITNGDEIIGSWNFVFLVEESPLSNDTIVSETDLPLLESALQAAGRLNEAFDDITEFTDETYPNAVEAIQNEGATQVANVTNEGTTQKGLVEAEGATQIENVQAEGTTQVGNVQAKGDEVIASIPSDYTELSGEVEDLKSAFSLIENNVMSGETILVTSLFTFERGSIGSRGQLVAGDFRIRTHDIQTLPYDLTMTVGTGYRFNVVYYTGDTKDSDSGWIREGNVYTIPKNSYFRLLVSAQPEDTTITADIETFSAAISIVPFLTSNVENLLETVNGIGDTTYFGDKIVLSDETTKRNCSINLWKSFKTSEMGDLSAYDFPHMQSMTIYNGLVFLFASSGICTIVNYSTKEIVGTCNFTPTSRQHANSAQFSDIYYGDNDTFPLLFLSRCGNAVTVTNPEDDACLIYRITENNGVYTMTQINSIYTSFNTYGISSWSIDSNSKNLYVATYANDIYQVATNNPVRIIVFNLPSNDAIKSGTPIVLNTDDIIAQMYYDHRVLQGAFANGGIVYSGVGDGGPSIWAIDVWKNRITSKVPLTASQEVEGVSMYDGKIYAAQRNGAGTDDEKLAIYELTF